MGRESGKPLVEARHLKMYFHIKGKGRLHAVDDVSFDIYPGETLGLVGESGCGKSTIGNVTMRLLKATDGALLFEGQDVLRAKGRERKAFCRKMQIIFQDPYSSLNPRKTVRKILREPFEVQRLGAGEALDRMVDRLCEKVDIPASLLDRYPHELDGGMRQVVGIARALAVNPQLIVCDEPVSSLDVSVQAKIINLLMDIQKEMGLSYLFISHDLSVVEHISDTVGVMYLGNLVEYGDTVDIFKNPLHPYTKALFSAIPIPDPTAKMNRIVLEGSIPSPANPPAGCKFHTRCANCMEKCKHEAPEQKEIEPGHFVVCHLYDK